MTFPALTWQESMSAMLLYNEEVQHQTVAQYPEGKPVRIIPAVLAVGWARTMIDQGKLPGVTPGADGFDGMLFIDQVHERRQEDHAQFRHAWRVVSRHAGWHDTDADSWLCVLRCDFRAAWDSGKGRRV